MSFKNWILLLFVRLLRKKRCNNPSNRHFLIISTTGLGDTLWATPALQALRQSFPSAAITLLTTPLGEQVLRHNPWVDEMIVFEEPLAPKFFSLWRMLTKKSIDTVLVFHASQRAMLPLASLLGAKHIVGTNGINKNLDSLLTHAIDNRFEHEIVRRLQLIEAVGGKRGSETLSYFPTEEEILAAPKLPKNCVALHPGSKDGFKRWPAAHFIYVGKRLVEAGYHILITGASDEKELMQTIGAEIPNATLCSPHLSLRAFAALLQQVALVISNDTGPVHLSCALKVPVLSFYAPTNPLQCGPHAAKKALAFTKPKTCDPCRKRNCAFAFCLLQIGPEDVVNSALDMLKI